MEDEEERWNAEALKVKGRSAPMHAVYLHPCGSRLFLGDDRAASDLHALRAADVTAIINCTRDLQQYHQKCTPSTHADDDDDDDDDEQQPTIDYFRCIITQLRDVYDPDQISAVVGPALDFCEDALGHGRNVLVHCLAGAHRSAVFVAVYLVRMESLSAKRAFKVVTQRRPCAQPSLYGYAMDRALVWLKHEEETLDD